MPLERVRRRSGYLFLIAIVGHIVLISAQVPADSRSDVPVLESVTFGVFSEIQRGVSAGLGGVRRLWNSYIALRGVRAENEALKRELAEAQVKLQEERARAEEGRRLAELLELRDRLTLKTTAATIIAAASSPDFQTRTLDKGSSDGLRPDMAVIAPEGVVGRIVIPSARAAKVQLLIDQNAAAGALIERSRAQGVAVGAGRQLRLEYVSDTADVQVGDVVVTSGIDGIYPKGFVIGRIDHIERGTGAYKNIIIRPAVDFNRLEQVLVVLTPPAPDEAAEGS